MNNLNEKITSYAAKIGVENTAFIKVSDIPFNREFRAACEQNICGKYGDCWMCPPDVGDIDSMIAQAKKYTNAFIFQTIYKLEDSFDIEGMLAAAKKHNDIAFLIFDEAEKYFENPLKLGAGACQYCENCSKKESIPCPFPEKAIASLESYGIAVSELAALCNLNYINGQNTVTYFGGFLYE